MKIFVTGATGYLGSAIAEKLTTAGHEVHGLARTDASAALLRSRNIHPVAGALDDLDLLTATARETDAVVQAAFQLGSDIESSVRSERQSVEALMAGVRNTGKPLLFTSGAAVLGDTGKDIFEEDSSIAPHPFRGRFETEQLVLRDPEVHGVVIRPPNVYGRGDGRGILALLRGIASGLGAVPYAAGTSDHRWSFVHVDDLADLFVLALTSSPRGELFHAGAESGLRTESIARAISVSAGLNGSTVELAPSALRSLFPVPALADYWAMNSQSSRKKSETVLGWRPLSRDVLGEIAKPRPTV